MSGSNHRCGECGKDFTVMCGSPALCCGPNEQPISPLRWTCPTDGAMYGEGGCPTCGPKALPKVVDAASLFNRLGDAIHELADEDSRKSRRNRTDAVLLRFADLVSYMNRGVR